MERGEFDRTGGLQPGDAARANIFRSLRSWDVKIIGTDISRHVVEYAQKGRYRRLEVNRGLPARMLVKYMVRDGEVWDGVPTVRSMCEFRYANLCAPLPQLPVFDLVLLRNVLLYFSQHDRRTLFGEMLSQDGAGWISGAGECGAGGGFHESF